MNKLIINQDVLLRTPVTQVRRQIKDDKKIRKVKKNTLLNIWPTNNQIDL
jgi:hypothetical protein